MCDIVLRSNLLYEHLKPEIFEITSQTIIQGHRGKDSSKKMHEHIHQFHTVMCYFKLLLGLVFKIGGSQLKKKPLPSDSFVLEEENFKSE